MKRPYEKDKQNIDNRRNTIPIKHEIKQTIGYKDSVQCAVYFISCLIGIILMEEERKRSRLRFILFALFFDWAVGYFAIEREESHET